MSNIKEQFPEALSFGEFRTRISILELAYAHGYNTHKPSSSQRNPVLKNDYHDDLIVIGNPKITSNQYYFNPKPGMEHDKGTLINFIKYRLGTVFKNDTNVSAASNINRVLYDYMKT